MSHPLCVTRVGFASVSVWYASVSLPSLGVPPCGLFGFWPYGLWTLAVWRFLICAASAGVRGDQVVRPVPNPAIPRVPQCPRLSGAWIIGGITINLEVTSHGGRAGANAIERSKAVWLRTRRRRTSVVGRITDDSLAHQWHRQGGSPESRGRIEDKGMDWRKSILSKGRDITAGENGWL